MKIIFTFDRFVMQMTHEKSALKINIRQFIFATLTLCFSALYAKVPLIPENELLHPPSRIIRTCCSFGSNVRIALVPFKKISELTGIEDIGPHQYLGGKAEGNGIIYTQRGGFIDMGHMRDLADWTAYLYTLIKSVHPQPNFRLDLGNEGGSKTLILNIPENLDSTQIVLLAGKIAYDLSVWHEIATWFGVSYVPMIPERYSSFSPEDLYSNLLGVTLGMQAVLSDAEYDDAMTNLVEEYLREMVAASTKQETYLATEKVLNQWWTRDKALPSKNILLKRYFGRDEYLIPWQIPSDDLRLQPMVLSIPTCKSVHLDSLYVLEFELNYKFPRELIQSLNNRKMVTEQDFNHIVQFIAEEDFRENNKPDSTKRSRKKEDKKNRLSF